MSTGENQDLAARVEPNRQDEPVAPLYQGEAQIWIDASPEEVYALVSDITRMGEYSP